MVIKKSKQVATTKTQLPATDTNDRRERMKRDAGRGISTKASDNLVPLLQVLQPLSPQVLAKNQQQIKGAKPGDFIAKVLADPVISGEDGIYFQPVGMYEEWVEWVPRQRGGGFIGRHDYNEGKPPAGAKLKPNKEGSRKPAAYSMGENDLVDTRYVPGYMWADGTPIPFVIPFTSTGHAVARGWMTRQTQLQLDGGILPAWAAVYQLTTKSAKNNLGEWYKIEIGAAVPLFDLETGEPNDDAAAIVGDCDRAYEMGNVLNTAFEKQEKRAHVETLNTTEEENM